MEAIVECIKGSKEKIEKRIDAATGSIYFTVDRMLKRPWVASYGYIDKTLQADGDELDTYIVGRHLQTAQIVEVLPICLVYCVDNGEVDNKLICGARTARRNIMYDVKRILRYIKKYKKGSIVAGITWKESDIRYELAKCRAFYKLFNKGGKQQ